MGLPESTPTSLSFVANGLYYEPDDFGGWSARQATRNDIVALRNRTVSSPAMTAPFPSQYQRPYPPAPYTNTGYASNPTNASSAAPLHSPRHGSFSEAYNATAATMKYGHSPTRSTRTASKEYSRPYDEEDEHDDEFKSEGEYEYDEYDQPRQTVTSKTAPRRDSHCHSSTKQYSTKPGQLTKENLDEDVVNLSMNRLAIKDAGRSAPRMITQSRAETSTHGARKSKCNVSASGSVPNERRKSTSKTHPAETSGNETKTPMMASPKPDPILATLGGPASECLTFEFYVQGKNEGDPETVASLDIAVKEGWELQSHETFVKTISHCMSSHYSRKYGDNEEDEARAVEQAVSEGLFHREGKLEENKLKEMAHWPKERRRSKHHK